ncbi:MAG: PEP-CTERM sorting domain-containing protein [Phycisphaerales bacterium]
MSVAGIYNLNAGTLEIELGGVGNPHDLVTVTGNVSVALLGTTLDLSPLGAMAAGTYTVLESTGGSVTGAFEHVTGIASYPGLVNVQYAGSAVTITLTRDFLPGDVNADGFVGIADLNVLLGSWNQSVTAWDLLSGDTNGDGFVGIEDLNWVLSNWNAGSPPGNPAQIPEPGAVLLLGGGLLSLTTRRGRP